MPGDRNCIAISIGWVDREAVVHLEHDARAVRAHPEALQRGGLHRHGAVPRLAILPAESLRVRHRLERTEHYDRDRLAVSLTDAQGLTPDFHACRILAAFAHDVSERADRRRLAAPPAGLPANPRATLRRHAAGEVSLTHPCCTLRRRARS